MEPQIKAITPDEVQGSDKETWLLKTLMDHVNFQIINKTFHYNSKNTTDNYFVIKITPYTMDEAVINKVVDLLRLSGWDAHGSEAYCGHGPFKAIWLRTESFNPQKILFTAID